MSNVTIVPAQPGYILLYKQDGQLFADAPVIAWAIQAELKDYQLAADVFPITNEGAPSEDYFGFLNPDGSVTAPHREHFSSIEEAQKSLSE
jgi:hypothetical protein